MICASARPDIIFWRDRDRAVNTPEKAEAMKPPTLISQLGSKWDLFWPYTHISLDSNFALAGKVVTEQGLSWECAMKCEIEFLPVGDGTKAGDAIVIRYGEPDGYWLMIVDGGTLESGKELVQHVRQEFGSQAIIADVVLTHSDADHASGLREVLMELDVRNFWLHMPWTFSAQSRQYFEHKNWTDESLGKKLHSGYDMLGELVRLAVDKKIPIHQPFAGDTIGPFRVVSPYQWIYPIFLAQFDRTPAADQAAIEATKFWIGKQTALTRILERFRASAKNSISETWDNERLKDGGVTSATNETSVVLYGAFEQGRVLLTGDAGQWGLHGAVHYCQNSGLPLQNFQFVQIPHHGSRRNVGPTILNQLLGPIRPETAPRPGLAYVSAPKDDENHPRKIVLNAFMRRGFAYHITQGKKIVYWGGFPPRPNYRGLPPCTFNTTVENYD
jgi:beta-lactamase superfamily II metal-dependent hydrolase